MKRLVIGFLVGLLAFPAICDLIRGVNFFTDNKVVASLYSQTFMVGYGLEGPFTQNCTKDVSQNGHGWVFVNREYFKCGRLAIFVSDVIWGEKVRTEESSDSE